MSIAQSLTALACCCCSWLNAAEFVLVDAYETSSSPYRLLQDSPFAGPDIPEDWTAPVDYVNGTWHSRLVIHRMGNGKYPYDDVGLLITMRDGDGKEDAHPQYHDSLYRTQDIGTATIVTYSHPTDRIWKQHGFRWDTQPAKIFRVQPRFHVHDPNERFDLTVKDIGQHWRDAPGASSPQDVIDWIAPYEYSYQVVIVAAGDAFSGWDNYPMRGVEVCGIALAELEALPRIRAALQVGQVGQALELARSQAEKTADASVSQQAQSVVTRLVQSVEQRRASCEISFAENPLEAVERLAELAATFAGCAEGTACLQLGKTWIKDDRYRDAKSADRRYAKAIAFAGTLLQALPADGPDEGFRSEHAAAIASLDTALSDALERYPATPACRELLARGRRLGIVTD